ncbi:hypothetical protein BDR03DRAFT_968210 [Suillus americanus]|nr:hypothetical protein BDR03DRAFT_968210 [Suillus americanus]
MPSISSRTPAAPLLATQTCPRTLHVGSRAGALDCSTSFDRSFFVQLRPPLLYVILVASTLISVHYMN